MSYGSGNYLDISLITVCTNKWTKRPNIILCMNIGTLLGVYMESWRIVLGKELRNVRKENGWTQSDVAAKAGIKRAVVSEIENGKFLGAISTLDRYLTLARVDLKPQRLGFDLPQLESLDNIFKDED